MIAWNGILVFNSGNKTKIEDTTCMKNWRTDEVKITWL
jgi:tRNA A37 threonylcarbamoyltransferase TsaD